MDEKELLVEGTFVGALFDYSDTSSAGEGKLKLIAGQKVQVLQQLSSGWWDGICAGQRGWFPSNFVSSEPKIELIPPLEEFGWINTNSKYFFYNQLTGETATLNDSNDNRNTIESTSSSISVELPLHWGEKRTVDGRPYYYNMMTNHTTWNRDRVFTSSVMPANNSITIENTQHSRYIDASMDDKWLQSGGTSNWHILRHTVTSLLAKLKNAARKDVKADILSLTSQIVHSLHLAFVSSALLDRDSPILRGNRMLRIHHRHIMKSVGRLVLIAKQASTVWPPPDAGSRLINEADEVLLIVRNFTDEAYAANVSLQESIMPRSSDNSDRPDATPRTPASQSSYVRQINSVSEQRAEQLLVSLDETVQGLFDFVIDLRAHLELPLIQHRTTISITRNVVSQIGQLLSLVSDLPINEMPEELASAIDLCLNHQQVLNEDTLSLVSAATQIADPMAPDDACEQLTDALIVTENSAVQLIFSAKHLIEEMHNAEQASLTEQLNQLAVDGQHTFTRSRRALSMSASKVIQAPPTPVASNENLKNPENSRPKKAMHLKLATPLSIDTHVMQDSKRAPASAGMASNESVDSPSFPGPLSPAIKARVAESRTHVSVSLPSRRTQTGRSASSMATPDSSKLSRFFGESISPDVIIQEDCEWYLASDYDARDILLSIDGSQQVKGGTLYTLVERLTSHEPIGEFIIDNKFSYLDVSYSNAFLLTYRSFMSADTLITLIMARFSLVPLASLMPDEHVHWVEKKLKPTQSRVVNVLLKWMDEYFFSTSELMCLDRIVDFADQVVRSVLPSAADTLVQVSESRRQAGRIMYSSVSMSSLHSADSPPPSAHSASLLPFSKRSTLMFPVPPTPILPKNLKKSVLIDLDPQEVARQLTILESRLFSNVQALEFLNKAWSDKTSDSAPNIKAMIESTNQITGWVAGSILIQLDIKKRSSVMKFFIQVAERCRSLNNFNTLMAILAALSSSPIHRLKRTRDLLSAKSKATLEDLKRTMAPGQNFATYRNLLKSLSPPCVPFLGRYLTDLTFIEDGNPDTVKSAPHLLNFDKRFKTSEKIREIQQYQRMPYTLVEVREIQSLLFVDLSESERDAEQLYQQSLAIEPREREDEKIARLLQESGFL